jgi:hypothetical protein
MVSKKTNDEQEARVGDDSWMGTVLPVIIGASSPAHIHRNRKGFAQQGESPDRAARA